MADMAGFKKMAFLLLTLVVGNVSAQTFINEGRIVFERRTNLEKRFEGMEDNQWMRNVDLKEPKIDRFELFFTDSFAAFVPIQPETMQGMREWLTMKNTSFQNLSEGYRKQKLSIFGTDVLLKDTIKSRTWKMTNSTREIAGFNCRQAMWAVNDSVRIYAWYSEELIPSVGPETFNGLPGVILGLATEDGGVVYFAKKVEVGFSGNIKDKAPQGKPKDFYTEEGLSELMKERFSKSGRGGGFNAEGFLMDLFMW